MTDRCVPWQCESLVAMRGIVLGSPQALVMEWMPLGPLNLFLKQNSLNMEVVELIEGASQIAKALWFLVSDETKFYIAIRQTTYMYIFFYL